MYGCASTSMEIYIVGVTYTEPIYIGCERNMLAKTVGVLTGCPIVYTSRVWPSSKKMWYRIMQYCLT